MALLSEPSYTRPSQLLPYLSHLQSCISLLLTAPRPPFTPSTSLEAIFSPALRKNEVPLPTVQPRREIEPESLEEALKGLTAIADDLETIGKVWEIWDAGKAEGRWEIVTVSVLFFLLSG